MYKCANNLLPKSVNVSFENQKNIHNYNTRNCKKLNVYRCRTTRRQSFVTYLGPKLWNTLPDSIKDCVSLMSFKVNMKKYLIAA